MTRLTLNLRTLTPLITTGADGDEPELRAPSFRGMLRYWLRALIGTRIQEDMSKLQKAESDIFGSTEKGSYVSVRARRRRSLQIDGRQEVLPTRFRFDAFEPGGEFSLILKTHPLEHPKRLHEVVAYTVFCAFNLGGVGRRARRGGGNLAIMRASFSDDHDASWLVADASDGEAFTAHIGTQLENIVEYITNTYPEGTGFNRWPDYPVLLREHTKVLIQPRATYTYEDALNVLWDLSGPHHHAGGAYGQVRPSRRASAIHMRVGLSDKGYHPMMTMLRSGSDGNWGVIQDIAKRASEQGFVSVFGNENRW